MRTKQIAMALVMAVALATVLAKTVGAVYINCDYFPYCWPF